MLGTETRNVQFVLQAFGFQQQLNCQKCNVTARLYLPGSSRMKTGLWSNTATDLDTTLKDGGIQKLDSVHGHRDHGTAIVSDLEWSTSLQRHNSWLLSWGPCERRSYTYRTLIACTGAVTVWQWRLPSCPELDIGQIKLWSGQACSWMDKLERFKVDKLFLEVGNLVFSYAKITLHNRYSNCNAQCDLSRFPPRFDRISSGWWNTWSNF